MISLLFPAVSTLAENSANDGNRLIFAGSNDYAPYSFYSDKGEATGFSVDLIKILSAATNKDITIRLMPWEECLSAIKSGKVQGLVGISVSKEWDKYMDFSEPVAEMEFAIFVESGNTYVNSLKSLEGTVVAVTKGSVITDTLRKDYRMTLVETDTVEEAIAKLSNREVLGIVGEKNVTSYYIQKDNIEDIKIVGPPIQILPYSIAVQHGNAELLSAMNTGISVLKENETLSKLQRKWLGLRLIEPFPWKMFFIATTGVATAALFLAVFLWVVSLNATVKSKTQQIQIMSQKMIEKDKLAVLGKLAGQIAHELRTPLSIINNSVFLLRKEGSADRDIFEKRLHILEEKIKLSSNILESILSYSRVKAEVACMISVKDCIEEVLKDLQAPNTIEKNITWKSDQPLSVFMDFHQLYSVLRNLALNAIQAMGETGKLTIEVSSADDGSTVCIRISDTGGGIADAARNKIFSLFYSTKITGTGLGLPISKSIIEANGGSLVLDETSETGSTFTVKLPSARSAK